ncbi:hypothetical protein KKG83_04400 [Candidatus Micrarchaeota archaeon]|nr:hypothetical protein [Candidatus Micrarchaeota archaeon]MBU2476685.1 hypothetical protein [Candidatus Micrarchaeota archaeon]
MCNIKENKIIKYDENKKEFSISYLLKRKDALKIYSILFDFCKELNVKYIEAEFFLFEKDFKKEVKALTEHSKILQKTKVFYTDNTNKIENKVKGYKLKHEFNKEFLKWFFEKYYPVSLIEINIFNQKNKKIAEFSKEHLIIFYNLNQEQIKKLKHKIEESGIE